MLSVIIAHVNDDDDTRRSPEFLREDRHEKNERSFFDWLRGKGESDEERLRKKLDKELKEAARRRAEDEELRRAEASNEEAETKKLKKKWRRTLLEKSRRQVEELSGDHHETPDGYTLAQLMVAERIVALHTTLEEEDLRRSEIKALKIHIDFMGLLSEKLSNPELEMPEEVEEVFKAVVEASSSEEILEKSQRAEDRKSERAEENHEDKNLEPRTMNLESDTEDTTSTRHLQPEFALLRTQGRPGVKPLSGSTYVRGSGEDGVASGGVSESEREKLGNIEQPLYGAAIAGLVAAVRRAGNQPKTASVSTETIPSPAAPTRELADRARSVAPSTQSILHEIHHEQTLTRLAHAVSEADRLHVRIDLQRVKEQTLGTPLIVAEQALQRSHELRASPELESLSTAELVEMARDIPLGHGRYLAAEFTHGRLDREGLVKVLKSHRKGLDYRSEFTRRSANFLASREHSPERLASPLGAEPLPRAPDDNARDNEEPPHAPARATTSPNLGRDTAKKIAHTLKKQSGHWLLAASALLVLVLFATIAVLTSL